jgi:hypothetical protein
MNTLAKLIGAEQNAQWMSMEHIFETVVPPTRSPASTRIARPLRAGSNDYSGRVNLRKSGAAFLY